jgi:gliding motility-associated-like protein
VKKILLITLLFSSVYCRAQSLVTVSGALISISPEADVFIDGSVLIGATANANVHGLLTVSGNIENFGNLNQSGQISLTGNWFNNGIYSSSNSSLLSLIGVNQVIGGDSISNFGQLKCENSGLKELENSISADKLDLGNCLFNTHEFSALVRNPTASALSFLNARVLSEFNGQIRRNINSSSLYLFPVGDVNSRWSVEYQSVTNGQIGVRYAPVDANEDGLSRFQVTPEICGLSDAAYVQFYDLPSPSGELKLRFPSAIANEFPELCVREINVAQPWSINSSGNFTIVDDTATYTIAPLAANPAYILGRLRPELPLIIGESSLCQKSTDVLYSIDSIGSNTLLWTVSGGESTPQTSSSISVNWSNATTGLVSVIATDAAGCSSLPGNYPIVLNPLPEAVIGQITPNLPFENEFYNLYSENISDIYLWQFESGQLYSDSSIYHSFDAPGLYSVVLQVENEFGCIDTAKVTIEILEGLVISNVITPNGDGINDYFELPNSGIIDYRISIFNRWGITVFESTEAKSVWDGRDASGNIVTPGTYFYLLEAKSALSDYSKKGSLQVIY